VDTVDGENDNDRINVANGDPDDAVTCGES
jgi:hypothetical protein